MFRSDTKLQLFTKLGLVRLGHLNKGRILFVEKDLHPMDITVNTCRKKKKNREIRTRQAHDKTKNFVIYRLHPAHSISYPKR